jgi:hypothetical protein
VAADVDIEPGSLDIKGSTQPEIYDGTVRRMIAELTDPIKAATFWQNSLRLDGPIEIWEINGERYLYNGNHRWHAALEAGARIPIANIIIVVQGTSQILTWPLDRMTRVPGFK